MTALITTAEIAQLLGAPLSDSQVAGYEAYIEVATMQLQMLLGYTITSPTVTEERIYYGRSGSRSIIVDPFTTVTSVAINGSALQPDDYFIGSSNRPFSYEVVTVIEQSEGDEMKIAGTWGFATLPASLKLLLANMFAVVSLGQATGGEAHMKSETVLSHSATFDTSASRYDTFATDNAALISLYRLPRPARVDGGQVRRMYFDDF